MPPTCPECGRVKRVYLGAYSEPETACPVHGTALSRVIHRVRQRLGLPPQWPPADEKPDADQPASAGPPTVQYTAGTDPSRRCD